MVRYAGFAGPVVHSHSQPAYFIPTQRMFAPSQLPAWLMSGQPAMQPLMRPQQLDPMLAWSSAAWYRQQAHAAQSRFGGIAAHEYQSGLKPEKRALQEDVQSETCDSDDSLQGSLKKRAVGNAEHGHNGDDAGAQPAAAAILAGMAVSAPAHMKKIVVTRVVKPNYNCGKCGQLKRGHVCTGKPTKSRQHSSEDLKAHIAAVHVGKRDACKSKPASAWL